MTVGTGILHPKVSNQFRVLFTVVALPGDDHEQLATSMRHLTMQTISVALPVQLWGVASVPSPARKFLTPITTKGDLSVVFEDDITHALARSILHLGNREIEIEVQILDGSENVLEIYQYCRCRLLQEQHSVLDYGLSTTQKRTLTFSVHSTQHGVLTPAQSGEL